MDTCALFFFNYTEMDSSYGKQAFDAVHGALRSSAGVCAFNDGDLFESDTARELAKDYANRVEPAGTSRGPPSPLEDLNTKFSFGCYCLGMWSDRYENFDRLHHSLQRNDLTGYLGFITLEGATDRNSFDGFLQNNLGLPRSIMFVNGEVVPTTSKYGVGNALSMSDMDLLAAVSNGSVDDLLSALGSGANVDCERPRDRGGTPLMQAVLGHEVEIARVLLKNGADPNMSNGTNTVLMLAARYGQLDMVELLLHAGADVNLRSGGGDTALTWVEGEEGEGYEEIAALLKASGGVASTPEEPLSRDEARELNVQSVSEWTWEAAQRLESFLRTGKVDDLEASIALATKAVQRTEYYAPEGVERRNQLGRALRERYLLGGSLSDLQLAINQFEYAAERMDGKIHDVPTCLSNLAISLLDRYQILHDKDDLTRSVDFHVIAADASRPEHENFALVNNNLAVALVSLNDVEPNPQRAQDAVKAARAAVAAAEPGEITTLAFLKTLGDAMLARFAAEKNPDDLESAIISLEHARAGLTNGSPLAPRVHASMAVALRHRYELIGSNLDLDASMRQLEEAARLGMKSGPGIALASARAWLMDAFGCERWDEVTRAYHLIEDAVSELVGSQQYRDQAEAWLQDSQGVAAHAAYASIRLGRLKDAACLLERGLARLLSRALALDNVDLDRLREIGKESLAAIFEGTVNRLRHLDRQSRTSVVDQTARREAQERLASVTREIREVPGFEAFLADPTIETLHAAARVSTLVYLAATSAGGFAVIVRPNGDGSSPSLKPVWLPKLSTQTFHDVLSGDGFGEDADTSYLQAFSEWRSAPASETTRRWRISLDATCRWMWEAVMADVCWNMTSDDSVALIPVGSLAYLPWHAASTSIPGTNDLLYALDCVPFSYSPNATSLTVAHAITQRVHGDDLLAVAQPKAPDHPPLRYARAEIQAIGRIFPPSTILVAEDITSDAVLREVATHSVVHFACHASADLDRPLQSGLWMTDGSRITLEGLLKLRSDGVRLAVLSACETGVVGATLPDELVSLPVGLMHAGTAGVVASLWPVSDRSTPLLMMRFYDFWKRGDLSPLEALRRAQFWLRDTTNCQKIAYLQESGGDEAGDLIALLSGTVEDEKSFSGAYYWAAFILVGV